jgi:hypothetical protein
MKSTIEIGETVRFAGELLTVIECAGDAVVCQWFNSKVELQTARIPAAAVRRLNDDRLRRRSDDESGLPHFGFGSRRA